jgi:hypothetical protein
MFSSASWGTTCKIIMSHTNPIIVSYSSPRHVDDKMDILLAPDNDMEPGKNETKHKKKY